MRTQSLAKRGCVVLFLIVLLAAPALLQAQGLCFDGNRSNAPQDGVLYFVNTTSDAVVAGALPPHVSVFSI